VAKWQTRWLQVPVFERTWGFKSPLAHESDLKRGAATAKSVGQQKTQKDCREIGIAMSIRVMVDVVLSFPTTTPRVKVAGSRLQVLQQLQLGALHCQCYWALES
jgi:hypothetical protein